MNEHEKALPAGGPAKLTQNAVKIYVISSRERLLLPLAFCFCLLLVNTLLWSGPTAGLTASVCVWYGLLGLYLGRTLLNTWESRVLLAVNLALAATLALGSNWYFRAWNLLALLALLPVHAIGLSGGQFLPWWRPSMLWERLCLLLWGLFGHLGAALATAWPQKKDGAARRVLPLLLGAAGALALLAVLVPVLASADALFAAATADLRAFAGEYKAVYAYLLQVTQGAKDMDALCAEIENSPYAFEIERTDDGELLSATYQHNYVLAQVEPQEIQSRAELEAEYQKEIAKFQDSLEKLGSDPEMAEEISRTYAQSTREQAYRSQVSGIVRLGLNSDLVGTDLDKRSARFLTVDTAGRQALFDRKMAGKKDRVVLEQLSGVVPYKWTAEYTLQRLGNCRYDWTYLVGSDKYRCEAAFSAKRQDTATAAAMEQLDRVAATVEKNPKLRRADLARKIGAKLQAPQVSEDRYTAQYDSLGSRFDQLKEWAHQRYELSFQYQFGDYYFCLAGKPYSTVTLYDKDGCLLSSRFLVSGDFSGTHGNLRRPLLDRGYYDRQGNFYPQPHFVPAYTRDGKAYLYYYWKSQDGDATKNVQYLYAMDDPAARLEPTGAYIDSDGYLVTGEQVKEKQKDGSVTGSDGKTYYPYLRTGWTAQGKPRLAHLPSELEEMLQDLDTAQNTE